MFGSLKVLLTYRLAKNIMANITLILKPKLHCQLNPGLLNPLFIQKVVSRTRMHGAWVDI